MVVYCVDCGTKNTHQATYCFKCGKKLQKKEQDDNQTATLHIGTPATLSSNIVKATQKTIINHNNVNKGNHDFIIGKYLYVGLKGAKPICSKITGVDGSDSVQIVSVEMGATLSFSENRNDVYSFIKILDEPYQSKCKCNNCNLNKSELGSMTQSQIKMLLFIIITIIILDILYIIAWSLDELTALSNTINCGMTSLYSTSTSNDKIKISYKEICNINDDDCRMETYGQIVLICTIIAFLLQNFGALFSIFVNTFYNKYFMKTRCHSCLFAGFVVGGGLILFAIASWDGKQPSKCSGSCTYFGESCGNYSNGVTSQMFYAIEAMSFVSGIIICVICNSESFIV